MNRELLWLALERLGITGHMLGAFKSLYTDVSLAVRVQGCRGTQVPSTTGIKQGCPLSPLLFGIYTDGLSRHLLHTCPGLGVFLTASRRVSHLGYADDFVLLADSACALQALINSSVSFFSSIGQIVSRDKTKVVASARSHIACQLSCGSHPDAPALEQVTEFKYLGLTFSSSLSLNPSFCALLQKQRAALALINQQCGGIRCEESLDLLISVFEACVPPTASYGCEVWSVFAGGQGSLIRTPERRKLSKLHLTQVKQLLGVRKTTPTSVLWQETHIKPLEDTWLLRAVGFYNLLCDMPESNLYRQIAQASLALPKSWAKGLHTQLRRAGLTAGQAALTMAPLSVSSVQACLAARRTRASPLCMGSREFTYTAFFAGTSSQRRKVLKLNLPAKHLRSFLRFRLGCRNLPVDRLCLSGVPRNERKCRKCSLDKLGDERHFLFECPALADLRVRFSVLFQEELSLHRFIWQEDLKSVANFVSRGLTLLQAADDV